MLKVDDGGTSHQEAGVKAEQVSSKPEQVKAAKSVKENLLGLLGSLKVDVTSKKKLKNLELKKSFELAKQYQSKPAAMQSTISMFQKATEEVSTQRWEITHCVYSVSVHLHCFTSKQPILYKSCFILGIPRALFFCLFSETLDPNLVAAASAAASTLPNSRQAESELLKHLRQRKALTEAQRKGDANNIG